MRFCLSRLIGSCQLTAHSGGRDLAAHGFKFLDLFHDIHATKAGWVSRADTIADDARLKHVAGVLAPHLVLDLGLLGPVHVPVDLDRIALRV